MVGVAKLLLVFIIVIVLMKKIDIGVTMAIAAVALALFYLIHPWTFLTIIYQSITALSTLNIVFSLLSIMLLAGFMSKEHMMQKMVGALEALVKDARAVMAMLPAIIGFIPIPGGALFTCSLVEEAQKNLNLSPEKKSYINYWFRHIWEFILPVYPGTLLTMEIFDIPYPKLFVNMYPFTLLAMLVGVVIGFRKIPHKSARHDIKTEKRHWVDLLKGISPVLIAVSLVLAVGLPLSISLGIVVIGLFLIQRYRLREVIRLIKESFTYKPISIVLGVVFFKNVLIESGAVENLAQVFTSFNLPILPVFYILPFFVGILTGNVTGFVGATFPILLGLLPEGDVNIRLVAIAFSSGFAGAMISPVHLCLVLTVQYFQANLEKVLIRVGAGEIWIVILATILYFLL